MFKPTNSNAIISKSKNNFSIFFCISKNYIKFWILSKKRWSLEVISFWNYILPKARLLKCLKGPVSEELWTVNVLKSPKPFLNLHGSIFVRFFDNSEKKISPKSSFLVVCEIYRLLVNILTPDDKYYLSVKTSVFANQFNCNYIEIKKFFSSFFCISEICKKLWILWRKYEPQRWFVFDIIDCNKQSYLSA